MGIFDKTNLIELNQEDLQDAKTTAGLFSDELVKRRAFANVIAARSALKLLFSLNIDATNLYSMYSINKVLERLDIADVYAGSVRIDARLVNSADEIFIPKSHFQLGITPDLYLILRLEKGMTGVEFLGCVNPDEMDKTHENKDYYFVDEDLLYNLKIFKNLVKNNTGKQSLVLSPEDKERAENLIIPLEDGDIFNADYEFLMKQLAYDVDLRKKTVEFENFEFVSHKVVTEETVYGDSVLGLIGSEKLYDRNEFSTDIDLEQLSDTTVDDFVENFNDEPSSIPEMNELTGEVSLDDALSQMEDVFGSENENIVETVDDDVIDVPPEDFEELPIDDENTENNNNQEFQQLLPESLDDFSENDFNELSEDISLENLDDDFDSPINIDDEENQIQSIDFEDESDQEPITIVEDENIPDTQEYVDTQEDNLSDEVFDAYHEEPIEEQGFSAPEEEQSFDTDFSDKKPEQNNFANEEDEEFSFDVDFDDLDSAQITESLREEDEDYSNYEDDSMTLNVLDEESQDPQQQNNSAEDDASEEEEKDLGDLPILNVIEETEDTYKQRYKTPPIDDVDLKTVNLDDFDDYDNEETDNESKNNELDVMMSDLDSILNSENISLDGVEDILTDEELNESLKSFENLDAEPQGENPEEPVDDIPQVASVENTEPPIMGNELPSQEIESFDDTKPQQDSSEVNESMSLDDFLNSSFNDMSSNQENSGMIDNNQNDSFVYEPQEDMNTTYREPSPDILLTDETTMVDNSSNLYSSKADALKSSGGAPQKSKTPQLLAILVVLLCACAYVNKDIIMSNFNFPSSQKEEEVPEFDLNKLREAAQPETPTPDSPIPTLDQPTEPAPEMPAPIDENPVAGDVPPPVQEAKPQTPPTSNVGKVPQNSSNKITKLSWEVPEAAANNQKIRKYLQIAGRTLKLSLQNDLLVASELPFSNKVMLDLKIAPSGSLISSEFVVSSGSKQIDNIVLQSVKDTLKYVKPPLGVLQSPNSTFTLIINF